MIGTRLSHYRIIAHLGSGGMGEVYRAHDERLGRDVAIKVLPGDLLADDTARARLRREARSLSQLSHPNICTVFDFDSDGDRTFMVIELLDGESLAERVSRGPLGGDEVRRIGRDIASALEAAQEKGVVHRDLKPGNVILTKKGVTKVLDFGLARVNREATPSVTTQSVLSGEHSAGTLPYMAPEQVRGEAADGRTDIYGLGATLYELATGRRPFTESQPLALAAAILYQPPPPPGSLGTTVDPALAGVILRCMEKDPARRFQSAAEVREALASTKPIRVDRPPAPFRPGARVSIAVTAVLLATVAVWFFMAGGGKRWFKPDRPIRAVAVLPLTNLSGDASQEFFADGMTEELITTLGQIAALRVTSRGSVMRYKGSSSSPREIARALGVGLLVEGAVMRSGDQVRISAKLIEAAADRILWSGSFDRKISQVLALQSDVANAVVEAVRVRTTPEEKTRLRKVRATDPAALDAYMRGRALEEQYSQEALQGALRSYQKATTIQPDFAPAHAGIAAAYLKLSGMYLSPAEAMPRAEAAARRAVEIDSASAGAVAALAYVEGFYRFDWPAAEAGLRRAIALNPSDALSHATLGYLLTVNGRFEEAITEIQRARASDPFSQAYAAYSLFPYYEGRRYDDAIRAASEILRADPNAQFVRMIRAQAYSMNGDYTSAIRDLETAAATEEQPHILAYLIYVQARAGADSAAQRSYALFRKREKTAYVQPYTQAVVSLARGKREEALDWLERGVDSRNEEVVFLKVDPVMDPLRSDPRYQALLRRLGFEK